MSGPTPTEKEAARSVAPLRARGNQLLVTLLLVNTMANELLPLVLDVLYPGGYLALMLSVLSVVVFGEILPQAVCSRHALRVGAATAGLTRLVLWIMWPIAVPVAWALDKLLGKELRTGYDRDRLKALIQMHGPNEVSSWDLEAAERARANEEQDRLLAAHMTQGTTVSSPMTSGARDDDQKGRTGSEYNRHYGTVDSRQRSWSASSLGAEPGRSGSNIGERFSEASMLKRTAPFESTKNGGYGVLSADEASILLGALELSTKTVVHVMTRAADVFCLSVDERLDRRMLRLILRKGHSRIPIFDGYRANVIAILLVKQLLLVDPDEALPIRSIIRRKKRSHKKKVVSPVYVSQSCHLLDLFNEFQVGRSHMAIVVDSLDKSEHGEPRRFLGIVTLEDIMEEIIMEEVLDETDVYVDNERRRPILVKGGDQKWHYSIPAELLARRQRNPRLIRYRDIDESAYTGEPVQRTEAEESEWTSRWPKNAPGDGDASSASSTMDAAGGVATYDSHDSEAVHHETKARVTMTSEAMQDMPVHSTTMDDSVADPQQSSRLPSSLRTRTRGRRRQRARRFEPKHQQAAQAQAVTTEASQPCQTESDTVHRNSDSDSTSNEYLEYDFEAGTYVDPPSMLSLLGEEEPKST